MLLSLFLLFRGRRLLLLLLLLMVDRPIFGLLWTFGLCSDMTPLPIVRQIGILWCAETKHFRNLDQRAGAGLYVVTVPYCSLVGTWY
jgi:hypothetical protein